MNLILKSLGIWLFVMLIANLNGAFREFVLKRFLRERGRSFISTIMLLAFFWIIAYFFIKWQAANYDFLLFAVVGVIWLVLTLAFEFGFGHYLAHHPWSELLAEYDVTRGRIWILVPLSTLIAPIILALIFKGAG
jgi:hypothetical protein